VDVFSADEDLSVTLAHSYEVFGECISRALEYISCMIFYEAIYYTNQVVDLLAKDFHVRWEADAMNRREGSAITGQATGEGMAQLMTSSCLIILAMPCQSRRYWGDFLITCPCHYVLDWTASRGSVSGIY